MESTLALGPPRSFMGKRYRTGEGLCSRIETLFLPRYDEHAVRLVHKLDLALWEQPVLLPHGRRDGDLAFACNLHANTLAQAAR